MKSFSTKQQKPKLEAKHCCFICATPDPLFWAVGPCGHPYCALCALRLRALLSTKACPMCKSVHDSVFVADDYDKIRFKPDTPFIDSDYGIVFDSGVFKTQVLSWLKASCVICQATCKSKNELLMHLEERHRQLLCPLCILHRPIFPFEQTLYPDLDKLNSHQNSPKEGHPPCKVCNARFYSEDELIIHIRNSHQLCPICARRNQWAYFADYAQLEHHFEASHIPCKHPLCQELKFVVFESQLEYKAHVQQLHLAGAKMQRSQQRLASRLDLPFSGDDVISTAPRHPGRSSSSFKRREDRIPKQKEEPKRDEPKISIDPSSFIFDPQQLESHAQSLAALDIKNKEFLGFITAKYPQASVKSLKSECRKLSGNKTNGRELIHWMIMERFDVQTIVPKLVELLPDSLKQKELQRAMDEHIKMQAAFPALPSRKPREDKGKERSVEPIRGRILSSGRGRQPGAMNPSRYPTPLLGSLGSVSANRPGADKSHGPSVPNISSLSIEEDDDQEKGSVFTIGDSSQPPPQSTSKTKKKKGDVLLRFGGFSNPINNT